MYKSFIRAEGCGQRLEYLKETERGSIIAEVPRREIRVQEPLLVTLVSVSVYTQLESATGPVAHFLLLAHISAKGVTCFFHY